MNLNKPYRKRSWFVALVFHMIILGVIIIVYFSFDSRENKHLKVSVDKSHVMTANLLSIQQSQALEVSENQVVKKMSSESKPKLVVSNNGKDHNIEIKKDITDKPKSSLHQNAQEEHLATKEQVAQYLSSLTTHLYTEIQKMTQITQNIKGNLYVTLQVNGTLSNIQIKLSPKDESLHNQLKYILKQYHHSGSALNITKPIKLNIPVVFN